MKSLRRRLGVALAVVAAFAVGAWLVAVGTDLTTTVTVVTEPPPPLVSASVEVRTLEDTIVGRGTVIRTGVVPISAPALDSARAVVTSINVAAGAEVVEGTVLGSVSGRPVIAMEGSFIAYRELVRGSEGVDVIELQEALTRLGFYTSDVDGVYGRETERAVRDFYVSRGYVPASAQSSTDTGSGSEERGTSNSGSPSTRVPLDELAFVAELPATVADVHADVGDVLADGVPLVELSTGEVLVRTKLPAARIGELSPGVSVVIFDEASGVSVDAEIDSIADQPTTDSGLLEYDALIRPSRSIEELVGKNVQVTTTITSSSGPVLAVPITALWTRGGTDTLVTLLTDDSPRDVVVTPGIEVGGWVEIVDAEVDLAAGDKVVVTR